MAAPAGTLTEGTDAQGGYLVRDGWGGILFQGLLRESAIADLTRLAGSYRPTTSRREVFAVMAGMPDPQFVGEGATKPVGTTSFAPWSVTVRKLAIILLYTDELLEDAVQDPRLLVNPRMADAFAHVIDAHALGFHDGAAVASNFDGHLDTVPTLALDATAPDALALAISGAMGTIEAAGYRPTGIAMASAARQGLRDARGPGDFAATPIYTNGFGAEPDQLYGLPIHYTSNLRADGTTPLAVVGDFRQSAMVVRHDLTTSVSNEATVGGSNLWADNLTGVRYEMRCGFGIIDTDAFIQVTGGFLGAMAPTGQRAERAERGTERKR